MLFLDELPEFNRTTLEVLRQPLEDGHVTISRALNSTTFPADFMLIASLNPCPCGYRNDPRRECHCSVPQIERYMAKISGPLLDRIDLHIEVPAVPFKELNAPAAAARRAPTMREQVLAARAVQAARFRDSADRTNAHMTSRADSHALPARTTRAPICCGRASRRPASRPGPTTRFSASPARSPTSTARADILPEHVSEAVNYRMLDRQFWS